MRKISTATVTATSAAALVLAFGSTADAATLTVTVTNGGNVTAANSGNLTITDTNTGTAVTCTASTGSGSVPNASLPSATSPVKVGSINSISFSGCSGSGFNFTVTPKISGTNPWNVNVAGTTSNGDTPGGITGISAHASAAGGLCTLDIDGTGGAGSNTGTTNGDYNNGTGKLSAGAGSSLRIFNVSGGCFGLARSGDSATLSGAYIVKNSAGTFPQISSTSP
jgi:hypothetical protein